jgi:IS5 family transposase
MSRKRNWREYNKELVQRGSLTFLIDPKLLKKTGCVARKKKLGRPLEFSNTLIMLLLMVKIHHHLPYRTLEGFMKFLCSLKKLFPKTPTYSLVCKRAAHLRQSLPKLSSRRPSTVLIDATGIKVYGEGEWKVKVHGPGRPRKWMKIHIAVDAASQEIVAVATTESNVHDSKMTKALLDEVPGTARIIIADGGYDGSNARKAVSQKKARALIPPPKNARYRGLDDERDQDLLLIRGLGGDKRAKSIWAKLTGYSRRALVESTFSRFKGLFGERYFSKTSKRQEVETILRCLLLNKTRAARA